MNDYLVRVSIVDAKTLVGKASECLVSAKALEMDLNDFVERFVKPSTAQSLYLLKSEFPVHD